MRRSPGVAPTAERRPISRVRSVTDTSMMFMMPMPPTSRDTAATHASRLRNASVVASWVAMMSCWVCTMKSALFTSTSWRRASRALDLRDGIGQRLLRVGLQIDRAHAIGLRGLQDVTLVDHGDRQVDATVIVHVGHDALGGHDADDQHLGGSHRDLLPHRPARWEERAAMPASQDGDLGLAVQVSLSEEAPFGHGHIAHCWEVGCDAQRRIAVQATIVDSQRQ